MEENIVKYLCMKFQVILRTCTITGGNINDFANYCANLQNPKIFFREKKWVYTLRNFSKFEFSRVLYEFLKFGR